MGLTHPEDATCLEEVLVFAFPFFVILNGNRDALIASDNSVKEAFNRNAERALEMLEHHGVFEMEGTSQGVMIVEMEDAVHVLSAGELKRRAVRFRTDFVEWQTRQNKRTTSSHP